jgi:hypothetical protein
LFVTALAYNYILNNAISAPRVNIPPSTSIIHIFAPSPDKEPNKHRYNKSIKSAYNESNDKKGV